MAKGKKKRKLYITKMTLGVVFAFLVAISGALFAYLQITRYESGVIEIYAQQQDSYVQLVLDQVNVNRGQKDEKIITDIIGTLDSSNNRYWTLAGDATIIFVKDVTETNRYKGFTTDTYYVSDSAKEFIDSMVLNQVTHSLIEMNGREYIASGVVFNYQDGYYQICLLTNPDAVLDHNAYLGARINLSVMIAAVLCIFLITVIALVGSNVKKSKQIASEQENGIALSRMIEHLNAELVMHTLYDARLAVFQMTFLPMCLEKLEQKERRPVTLMLLEYDTEKAVNEFLEDGYLIKDKKLMRFRDEEKKQLVLVAVGCNRSQATKLIDWMLNKELRLVATECADTKNRLTLEQAWKTLYEVGEKEDGR